MRNTLIVSSFVTSKGNIFKFSYLEATCWSSVALSDIRMIVETLLTFLGFCRLQLLMLPGISGECASQIQVRVPGLNLEQELPASFLLDFLLSRVEFSEKALKFSVPVLRNFSFLLLFGLPLDEISVYWNKDESIERFIFA